MPAWFRRRKGYHTTPQNEAPASRPSAGSEMGSRKGTNRIIFGMYMNLPAVLHVLPALGGGVDRYVRDIAHAVPRPQLLWHVGARAEVIETGGKPRFLPLDPAADERDPDRLAAWVRARGVG